MHHRSRTRSARGRPRIQAVVAAALAVPLLILAPLPPASGGAVAPTSAVRRAARPADFDSRGGETTFRPGPAMATAQAKLARRLGVQAVIQNNARTGTPRVVARLDGFLTGPSRAPAADIALGFVRSHLDAFGLTARDLDGLKLVRSYRDIGGTEHLVWEQRYNGIPVFDNDLRAHVTGSGRLISVMGSPIHGLRAPTTTPAIGAGTAVAVALRSVGATGAASSLASAGSSGQARGIGSAGGIRPSLVLFKTNREIRLAWHVVTGTSSSPTHLSVVDAATGDVLFRHNLTADATGQAWDYYASNLVPAGGGSQHGVTFPADDGTRLRGPNAWVFTDTMDDNDPGPKDQVPATSGMDWSYPVQFFSIPAQHCSASYRCTWDKTVPNSWKSNRRQNATQVYYYLNNFHDHLEAAPIGFNNAAGNFEGDDPVLGHTDDGAGLNNGLPDGAHRHNANMSTPRDGISPTMQMYLFPQQGGLFQTANGGDDASVVYHEYTHGLSNRLVTLASGWTGLVTQQSLAMGEAWSDWYALDYLEAQGFDPDTAVDGEMLIGKYLTLGNPVIRTEGMDCPVAPASSACPGGANTGPAGGYTYGDYGKITGFGPEIHADGEIWAQTLWQIRDALGSATTEGLVTRAMELSPTNPSFLDMRNAILQADVVNNAGVNQTALWTAFAERGMGFFAFTSDGNDTKPNEDFATPPTCGVGTCGTISGTVTDARTGSPLDNVAVRFESHDLGYTAALAATTNSAGAYSIPDVPDHTFERLTLELSGYEPGVVSDIVVNGDATIDVQLHFDWAARANGAKITKFSQPNFGPFCGPGQAIDGSLSAGWSSITPGPRAMTIRLPQRVNISAFGLDPGAVCGDTSGAALKGFEIRTKRSKTANWITAVTRNQALPVEELSILAPTQGKRRVLFVMLVMKTNRGDPFFIDMTELTVRGNPSA